MITHSPPPTKKVVNPESQVEATWSNLTSAKLKNTYARYSSHKLIKSVLISFLFILTAWLLNAINAIRSGSVVLTDTLFFRFFYGFFTIFNGFFSIIIINFIGFYLFLNQKRIKNIILRRIDHLTPKIDGISRKRILEHLWKFRTFSRPDFQKYLGHKDKYEPIRRRIMFLIFLLLE